MIDLKDHGIGAGGNTFTKFVKVTASLAEPINPKLYDIWLKTDKILGETYFNEIDTTSAENEVNIRTTDKLVVFKSRVDKGKIHVNMPVSTAANQKILETNYFDLYGNLGNVKYNLNAKKEIIEALYWDGVKWLQFSFSNKILLLKIRNPSSGALSWSLLRTNEFTPFISASISNNYLSYDLERNILYFSGVSEYDANFNLKKTIYLNGLSGYNEIFEKSGKYYRCMWDKNNGILMVFEVLSDGTTKQIFTKNGLVTGKTFKGIYISNDKKYLYCKLEDMNAIYRNYVICDISDIGNIQYKSTIDNALGSGGYTIGVLDDKIIRIVKQVPNNGRFKIEEITRDGLSITKSINTDLSIANDISTTRLRHFLGVDYLNNYYFTIVANTGEVVIEKVNALGQTMFNKTYIITYDGSNRIVMTKDNQIFMVKSQTELCKISLSTGEIESTITFPTNNILNGEIYILDEWRV